MNSRLNNNSDRLKKRVFFLGAGFSKCCGLPLGGRDLFAKCGAKERRDEYPEDFDVILNDIYGLKFFYPSFNENYENYPDVEEFCTLLNGCLIQNPAAKQMEAVLEAVKRQICLLIDAQQEKLNNYKNISTFVRKHLKEGDVIISLNYDTLIEKACALNKKEISYLYDPSKISVLKLHGSLNWLYKANVAQQNEGFKEIFSELEDAYINKRYKYVGGDLRETDKNVELPYSPIINPIYDKRPDTKILNRIWGDINTVLKQTDELIIIGFSIPLADMHIRRILSFIPISRCQIKVINPDIFIKHRFEECFGSDMDFLPTTFELSEYGK